MKTVSSAVLTLWMPVLFLAGLCLFLNGLPLPYWLICVPILPLLAYMNTLAEVHSCDGQICVRRWWGSVYFRESEVLEISPAMLGGIGRLRLRRFTPPWGVIYFVADWSNVATPQTAAAPSSDESVTPGWHIPDVIASILMGTSGFVLGRALSGDLLKPLIGRGTLSILAAAISLGLAALFAVSRRRRPTLANTLLFLATLLAALIRL